MERKVLSVFFAMVTALILSNCGEKRVEQKVMVGLSKNMHIVSSTTGYVNVLIKNSDIDGKGGKQSYLRADVIKLGVGPDTISWPQAATSYLVAEFSQSVTETVIAGIKADPNTGKVRFAPFIMLKNGTIIWFDLKQWAVDGATLAIVSDGAGGYVVEIQASLVLPGDTTGANAIVLPAAPAGITAVPGNGNVVVSWPQNATNTLGYVVFMSQGINGLSTTAVVGQVSTYTFVNLTNNVEYIFWVRAYNSLGLSESTARASAIPNISTNVPNSALAAPTGLAGSNNNGTVGLSWNLVPNAFGYQVDIRTAPSGGIIRSDNVGNVTNTQIANLTLGQVYYFSIQAYDGNNPRNFSPESSQISITVAAGTTNSLPAPTNLVGSGGNGTVNISWNAVAGAYGYSCYWGTVSGTYPNSKNVGNMLSAQVGGFSAGQTIYFVVKAYDVNGILSSASNEVAIAVTTLPTFTFDLVSGTTGTNVHVPANAINGTYFISAPPVGAGSQVCANSDMVGWAQASTACVAYSSGPTEFVIYNVVTNNGRFTGNISLRNAQTVVYAKLNDGTQNLWATNPAGGIVPDGNGGYHIDLQLTGDGTLLPPGNFTASSSGGNVTLSWSASPTPAVGYWLYYGDKIGTYNQGLDVGNAYKHTFAGFPIGTTKYFTAKSYSAGATSYSSAAGPLAVVIQP